MLFVFLALLCVSKCESTYKTYCSALFDSFDELPSGYSLVHLSIIHRHGTRTPEKCWPGFAVEFDCNDISRYSTFYDVPTAHPSPKRLFREIVLDDKGAVPGECLTGSLHSIGHDQLQNLGKIYRSFYVEKLKFVKDSDSADIFIRSSDYQRTKESVFNFLQGLFHISSGIFQFNISEKEIDTMLGFDGICPANVIYDEALKATDWYKEFTENVIGPLAKQFEKETNVSSEQFDFIYYNDCSMSTYCIYGNVFDFSDELMTNLYYASSTYYYQQTIYPTIEQRARVTISFFFNDILNQLSDVIYKKTTTKLSIFSAHDLTLEYILSALQVWYGEWTDFASSIAVELYQNNESQKYAVRLLYNGKTIVSPLFSSSIIDFDEFSKFVESLQPSKEECEKGITFNEDPNLTLLYLLSGISGFVIFGSLLFDWYDNKKNNR